MTISPEALEKARDAIEENIVMGDIDDDTAVITTGGMLGSIAAALQAERDAAAPKLPDDLAGLVERLNAGVVPCGPYGGITADDIGAFEEVADKAATTIQSLVARNAELESGLVETTEWLDDATSPYVWGSGPHIGWEAEQKRRVTAARSLLNKDRQP